MAALGVFAASFLLYLGCLYPTIAPRDSADMAAAALTLGVAHPPGYPLYALLGRAWLCVLPWGDPAYRLNVLSAVAGAAAVAGLFVLVRRRAGALGGLTAAALWALSAPLWKFSLLEEKYSLHALFAVVLLLLAEGGKESVFPRARLSGLLLGLGLVNHQSLLFWIPGALWLWRAEAARHGARPARLAAAAAPGLAAGLGLYAFLWVRLGSLRLALDTALRRQYGTLTLFAGLARPLTPDAAVELLSYAALETARTATWPAAAAALLGVARAWREDRARAAGWLAGAAAGPLFVLVSRFDASNWVARSVLEPAFLMPCLVVAAFAGESVGVLAARRGTASGCALALALAAAPLLRAPLPEHRDDFLAYDYVRDLRRAVPPGAALMAASDTGSFGLRWLAFVARETRSFELAPTEAIGRAGWLAARLGRQRVFLTGMGPSRLRTMGLPSAAVPLAPEGLVQELGVRPPGPQPSSVLRRPRAWARDESYARDAKLAYGFASWIAARLLEIQGAPRSAVETADLAAAATDPQDYWLQ